jgi:hypothetical protein
MAPINADIVFYGQLQSGEPPPTNEEFLVLCREAAQAVRDQHRSKASTKH